MRVCMLAYTFYESDNRVRRYAEALAKRGDQVDAVALGRRDLPSRDVIAGVNLFRIQKRVINERGPVSYLIKLLVFFLRSAWFVTLRHLRKPYDVIHVHSVPDFEVFAVLIPRLLGARVILDIHDVVPEFYASKFGVTQSSPTFKLLVAIERLSIAFSDHVIISNDLWHRKLVDRSVRSEKCTTIINYPDLSIFTKRERGARRTDEFVMCYPGTLTWHQGLDLAIEATGLLHKTGSKVRLIIIGDGPAREKLKTMVQDRHLEECVELRQGVAIEGIAELMTTIDLGVVPKRKDLFANEAFSTKILEFMAMDVPVLAARTRIDQYYFDDNLVQFFEPESIEDLAAKILFLLESPDRRATLVRNGSEFVARNNWDVKKSGYFELVDRLVNKSGVAAVRHSAKAGQISQD